MEEIRLPSNMGLHSDVPNSGAPVSFGRYRAKRSLAYLAE
jgi:hypothetical protein